VVSSVPSFDQLTLHTQRLHLRPLRTTDASALFAIFSDPRVMRYWSTPPWPDIDAAHRLIALDTQAMADGTCVRLGIERNHDGLLIGQCTLFNLNAQCRRAEVGYGLAHAAWGHGYMGEALLALLDYGFTELGLNRIEADIDPANSASARSLERLGFRREGHLRERWIVDGLVSDSLLYGVLLSDWQSDANRGAQIRT
jgi:ribosomal-protein-alanine N-acetyltransferase